MIDDKKLQQFLGKMLVDLGAAISVPLVRIGVRLGLYKALDDSGPRSLRACQRPTPLVSMSKLGV